MPLSVGDKAGSRIHLSVPSVSVPQCAAERPAALG